MDAENHAKPLSPEDRDWMLRTSEVFNLRKASRAITQILDDSLQPAGLRSTQLAVLVLLASDRTFTMGELADALVVSPSTLSRNLRPLARDGYIEIHRKGDRHKTVTLTERGQTAIAAAVPHWKEAQRRFMELIGPSTWKDTSRQLEQILSAVRRGANGQKRP